MSYENWQKKKIIESKVHQDEIYQLLNNQNYIKRSNKKITLDDNREYIEFVSCSYLGLDQDPRIVNSVSDNIQSIGVSFLSARTRIKYKGLLVFEELLNQIFSAHTITFSTTHLAHLGLIPILASGEMPSFKFDINGCHFLLDKTVHASIQINRGLMQQFGEVTLLDFHDLDQIEKEMQSIKKKLQTPILFSDSIHSMGEIILLKELFELVTKYSGYLYIDDAHGMSVYGTNGSGYVIDYFGFLPERIILTTSLGKGFGTCGGVVILPNIKDIEFVRTYCSTYMFSGTLVNPLINACIASGNIHLSSEIKLLQDNLLINIGIFDKLIENKKKIINFGYNSPIRGIFIGEELAAIEKGVHLKKAGFLTVVATYPIRKKGCAILRILICANHTRMEIERLCKVINSIL